MVCYNQENLIPNAIVSKTIEVNKEQNIAADVKLNALADKAINSNKRQDVIASK